MASSKKLKGVTIYRRLRESSDKGRAFADLVARAGGWSKEICSDTGRSPFFFLMQMNRNWTLDEGLKERLFDEAVFSGAGRERTKSGRTPFLECLSLGIHDSTIDMFVKHGLATDDRDCRGYGPFHYLASSRFGSWEKVGLLKELGMDEKCMGFTGRSPADMSVYYRNPHVWFALRKDIPTLTGFRKTDALENEIADKPFPFDPDTAVSAIFRELMSGNSQPMLCGQDLRNEEVLNDVLDTLGKQDPWSLVGTIHNMNTNMFDRERWEPVMNMMVERYFGKVENVTTVFENMFLKGKVEGRAMAESLSMQKTFLRGTTDRREQTI